MKFLAIALMLSLGGTPRVVKVEKKPDGRSNQGVVVMTGEKDAEAQASKGWLGVMLGNVPESLAAQLDVKGGILITNVVKGSPADEAGLEPHDIIVSVGDQEAGDDVADIVKIIGATRPGDDIEFVVLRDGEEKRIDATLGDRPAGVPKAFAWKVEAGPDAEVEDQIRTRGRFMFKSPEGDWIMKDLGDLKDMHVLPDDVSMMLPDAENRSVQVFVENGEKRVRTQVQRDGEKIEIEQSDDGPITVTRTDAQGNDASATYDSEADLQKSDEEAYDLLKGTHVGTFQFKIDALNDGNFTFDVDDAIQWHSQFDVDELHESLQRAQEAYQEALQQFHQLQDDDGKGAPSGKFVPHMMALRGLGKPRQTFEVRTDGTIEVRVRKGDSELVKLYANERELKKADQELFEKYRDLMDEE